LGEGSISIEYAWSTEASLVRAAIIIICLMLRREQWLLEVKRLFA
jgi:hypothetical protein